MQQAAAQKEEERRRSAGQTNIRKEGGQAGWVWGRGIGLCFWHLGVCDSLRGPWEGPATVRERVVVLPAVQADCAQGARGLIKLHQRGLGVPERQEEGVALRQRGDAEGRGRSEGTQLSTCNV